MNVAVDLDGTLAHWKRGHEYGADELGVGGWIDGAREAVERLLVSGHRVVVHSCRCTWVAGGGLEAVMEFVRSGGFEPVAVVGLEQLAVEPGQRRSDRLEPLRFADCPDCDSGLVLSPSAAGEPCASCAGAGVQVKPHEVGVWVGVGKPIAHWYVDDRGVHFDEFLGWESTLERLAELSGEEIGPLPGSAGASAPGSRT